MTPSSLGIAVAIRDENRAVCGSFYGLFQTFHGAAHEIDEFYKKKGPFDNVWVQAWFSDILLRYIEQFSMAFYMQKYIFPSFDQVPFYRIMFKRIPRSLLIF